MSFLSNLRPSNVKANTKTKKLNLTATVTKSKTKKVVKKVKSAKKK